LSDTHAPPPPPTGPGTDLGEPPRAAAPGPGREGPPAPETGGGPCGAVEGFLDPRCLFGWAADPALPPGGGALEIHALLRGEVLARTRTGTGRPGLFAEALAPHGFVLDLPAPPQPGDLAAGRLVLAVVRAGRQVPLPLRPRVVAQEQAAGGLALLARAEATLGPVGLADTLAAFGRPEGFGAARAAAEANRPLHEQVLNAEPDPARTSALRFPLGLRSADGGAVLGRHGHLFLLAGSNGEVARLGAHPAEREALVAAWLALIEVRRARCAAAGLRFVQLVVPEKSSLAPELLPDPAQGGPSPFLAALEAAIAARPELAACTVSGLAAMRAAAAAAAEAREGEGPAEDDERAARRRARREAGRGPGRPDRAGGGGAVPPAMAALLRPLDTHPSARGMHVLARAVLERLGEAPRDLGRRFGPARLATGDLARRFFAEPAYEVAHLAPPEAVRRFGGRPEVLERFAPPDGTHIGRWERCRTEGAPCPAGAVMFGNSVGGPVAGAGQNTVSAWLARWFARYAFHWRPELDWAEVEREPRPGVVICQTVERFMGRVPES
jgi:hypothetical protein